MHNHLCIRYRPFGFPFLGLAPVVILGPISVHPHHRSSEMTPSHQKQSPFPPLYLFASLHLPQLVQIWRSGVGGGEYGTVDADLCGWWGVEPGQRLKWEIPLS